MRLGGQEEGTGGLKGQPLQLELVVESGGSIVNDYQTAKTSDPTEADALSGLGDEAFINDMRLHVLVVDRVLSAALHNHRYPKPLTQEQILQKQQDAARQAIGRLPTT